MSDRHTEVCHVKTVYKDRWVVNFTTKDHDWGGCFTAYSIDELVENIMNIGTELGFLKVRYEPEAEHERKIKRGDEQDDN